MGAIHIYFFMKTVMVTFSFQPTCPPLKMSSIKKPKYANAKYDNKSQKNSLRIIKTNREIVLPVAENCK